MEIGGKTLEIKIKDWAEQTSGSCFVRYGDTEVLATAVISEKEIEGRDFFPLTVEYEERYYAAGKIYGSRFIRRETRPSDNAILISRMIDRSIRPRFPDNLKREVQVIVTCLSWDAQNDPDILGLIASSVALSISEIPWQGPVASLRIGKSEGKWLINPTYEEREKGELDLVLAGIRAKGKLLINMIELEGKEVSESEVLEGVKIAKTHLEKIIAFQNEIVKNLGKEKIILPPFSDPEVEEKIKGFLGEKLKNLFFAKKNHQDYKEKSIKLKEELKSFLEENYSDNKEKIKYGLYLFEKEKERTLQENILKHNKRPDDRKPEEIREISCQVGILPRAHGSGFFCRGATKVLSILTLGGPHDQQLIEGMEIVGKKRFLHHYNFPPYSTGEISPLRGPKRREIGHGYLVEKALFSLIPDFERFPYTIRIVSEVLSSNGSTSMASVSSASLALMDAGVPIKRPAAGIALGIVKDNSGKYKLLTDIQGPEDSFGGMDFKVAGTEKGITAIQLDVKIDGISEEILKEGLIQAKLVRMKILNKMKKTISAPREKLSPFAPKIYSLTINSDKIGEVIGPKGSIIKKISTECQVTIDIEETGIIYVTGEDEKSVKRAVEWIKEITKEVEIGEIFKGKVKRILNFGIFVEIFPGQVGLVHISNLAPYHIKKIEDVVKVGDIIPVKVISIDELGRINLSAVEAGFRPKSRHKIWHKGKK